MKIPPSPLFSSLARALPFISLPGIRARSRNSSWCSIFPAASETFAGYRTLGPVHSVAGRYPEAMSAAYDNLADVIARKAYPAWGERNGFAAHEICEEIRLTALRNLKDERLS